MVKAVKEQARETLEERKLEKRAREAEEREEAEDDEKVLHQIDRHIDTCRALYRNPLISDATRSQYDQMFEEIREKRKVEWAEGNVQLLRDTLNKAAQSFEFFEAKVQTAVSNHWISKESAGRWMRRFHDQSVVEWQREKWVKETFPKYVGHWKEVAEARDEVLKKAERNDVSVSDEPGLAALESRSAFLAMDYPQRRELVARVDGLILAVASGKKESFKEMRGTLQDAARGSAACIHSSEVGGLLRDVFSSSDPEASFERNVLPYLGRRSALRAGFEALRAEFAGSSVVPEGFRMPAAAQFLKWDEASCSAFLDEARSRLDAAVRESRQERKELDDRKKSVRAAMDVKDWRGAEESLAALAAEYPADKDFAVMRRFLDLHRDDEKMREKPEIKAILKDMYSLVGVVPSDMQAMYLEALGRGTDSFGKLMQHMAYAVWDEDKRRFEGVPALKPDVSDEPEAPVRSEQSEIQPVVTQESVEQETRASVQRIVGGERQEEESAEAPAEPAVLAVSDDAESQTKALDLLETQDVTSEKADHRGVVSESLSLKQQRHLVDHINAPLMSYLRTLKDEGVRFAVAA